MSVATYDLGVYGTWTISWVRTFDNSEFLNRIRNAIYAISDLFTAWTGRAYTVTDYTSLQFSRFEDALIAWRQSNNVSPTDVPDWLITAGASTLVAEGIKRASEQVNAILNRAIGDPYIPGVSLGFVRFLNLRGDEVSQRGSFDVEVSIDGGRTERYSIQAPGIATIRLPTQIYDVFGEKRSGVQWVGGILQWLRLPQVTGVTKLLNGEVLKDIFTPVHFSIPSGFTEVKINIEVPVEARAKLFVTKPDDFTSVIRELPVDLRSGLTTVTIRGRRTLFGTSPLPAIAVSIVDLRSIASVEVQPSKRRTFWW
ncbi:MAG: hypothetical protein QXW41_08110 [Fervidicoccaceae archaeon]